MNLYLACNPNHPAKWMIIKGGIENKNLCGNVLLSGNYDNPGWFMEFDGTQHYQIPIGHPWSIVKLNSDIEIIRQE